MGTPGGICPLLGTAMRSGEAVYILKSEEKIVASGKPVKGEGLFHINIVIHVLRLCAFLQPGCELLPLQIWVNYPSPPKMEKY